MYNSPSPNRKWELFTCNSVVKNTTYWLILINPDTTYVFEICAPIEIFFVTFRFVKITLHPRVKKLDLNNIGPKALRDEIYRGLEQLSGLETLNLGSGSGPGSTAGTSGTEIIRKRVFMSFKFLQNLTSLSFTNECQNETLAVVGQNCRHLSHLDIAGSQAVTDQGASWLLGCKDLTTLDLYQTAISIEGYAQLLLALTGLQSVGRCDAFGQILEYLATYNRDQIQLSIKYFHSRDVSYEQVKMRYYYLSGTLHVHQFLQNLKFMNIFCLKKCLELILY